MRELNITMNILVKSRDNNIIFSHAVVNSLKKLIEIEEFKDGRYKSGSDFNFTYIDVENRTNSKGCISDVNINITWDRDHDSVKMNNI